MNSFKEVKPGDTVRNTRYNTVYVIVEVYPTTTDDRLHALADWGQNNIPTYFYTPSGWTIVEPPFIQWIREVRNGG